MVKAKRFLLTKRCVGEPTLDDFTLEEFDLPEKIGEKYKFYITEILIEAEYLSADVGLRGFTIPHMPLGKTMLGRQVAKIIESKNSNWPVGKYVVSGFGWVTHYVFNPDTYVHPEFEYIFTKYLLPDLNGLPVSLGLGMLGLSGNTAYFGFLEISRPKDGETLVVSSAAGLAGAVGSHVGQIGRNLGMKVIGITGSDAKCTWLLDELNFDYAINYKTEDISTALKNAAPEGIDCYFDNVGGEIACTIINLDFGRITVCGSVFSYNADVTALPKATVFQPAMIWHDLKMEGFEVYRWIDRWMEGIHQNAKWIHEGKLKYRETVTEGFENLVNALVSTLRGENIGKNIVKIV